MLFQALQFHAHIYFTADTRESASKMRDYFLNGALPGLHVGRLEEGPRGPHPCSMFEMSFDDVSFPEVARWFLLHRGEHPVLIHAVTGNDPVDHERHALWMGQPQSLDYAKLDPPMPGWKPLQATF